MVPTSHLGEILLLRDLSEETLEKIAALAQSCRYKEREVIFEEGQRAESFYMLLKGKVLMEVDLSESVSMSLGSIKPGYCFGWSALIPDDSVHTTHTVAAEPSDVISVPGRGFLEVLREDPSAGRMVMERAYRIILRILRRRTGHFVKVMREHPELRKIMEAQDVG